MDKELLLVPVIVVLSIAYIIVPTYFIYEYLYKKYEINAIHLYTISGIWVSLSCLLAYFTL